MHLVALSLQCLQLFTDSKTGNFEVQCQLIVECGHSGGDENDEHDQHEHHDGEGQHSLVPNSRERQPGDLIGGSSAASSSKIEVLTQKQIEYYFLFKSCNPTCFQQVGVMGRLARLEELQRMKELVEAEIRLVKATISEELLEERKGSGSSYKAVAPLKTAYRGKGVHIMVIPVAEAVEKQLMVILRDKEEVLTEVLDVVDRNLNMMHETVDFIEDLVSFGQNQVSVVFGEHSAINRLFMSGVAPFLENMDDIFATISSLVSFKRGNLNSFLSEDYNRTELLQNIRNVAFDNILPAKVDFVAALLNNSESIRQDMDSMMHHMGDLIRLKQSVVDSVSTYIEQNR